jgi:hypothetical protein
MTTKNGPAGSSGSDGHVSRKIGQGRENAIVGKGTKPQVLWSGVKGMEAEEVGCDVMRGVNEITEATTQGTVLAPWWCLVV